MALALARAGAGIAVTARTRVEIEEVVAAIATEKGRAVALAADLADHTVPARLVRNVADALGPVDILVSDADVGSSNPKPVLKFDDAFWEFTLLVNLTVPHLLSKAVLPEMRKQLVQTLCLNKLLS
jgi:NAD(P)-dependent dehydrogenase (short-subunit alcohol dehydrogenase family)